MEIANPQHDILLRKSYNLSEYFCNSELELSFVELDKSNNFPLCVGRTSGMREVEEVEDL